MDIHAHMMTRVICTSAGLSSKRKLAARQLEFCESVDKSSSNAKRVKTTDGKLYA